MCGSTSFLLSKIISKFEENFHADSLLFDILQKYWHSNAAQHDTLRTLHLVKISSDRVGQDRCPYAYCIQDMNGW